MRLRRDTQPRHELVTAVLRDGDLVLLCHRSPQRRWYPGVWDLPGGHVRPGEPPPHALARELHEELGISIAEPTATPPIAVITAADFRMQVWLVKAWGGTPMNVAADEHDDLAWVGRGQVAALQLAHADLYGLLADVLAEPT
jgi:8-oxo-dGTP diphosphatase